MKKNRLFRCGIAAAAASVCLMSAGCASQSGFSKSFPRRLAETQNQWRSQSAPAFAVRAPGQGSAGAALAADGIRVQDIMDRLVYVSPLRGYAVRTAVVADPRINAFTNGLTVFIHSGLLQAFQDREDLIASVLAHELAHILGRHIPEDPRSFSILETASYLTPALGVLPYGGLYSGAAGSALRQGARIRHLSYSRLQETEADVVGAILADRAGYNAYGLCEFFDAVRTSGFGRPLAVQVPLSLGAIPESAAVALLSASPLYRVHPPSEKRKDYVRVMLHYRKGILPLQEVRRRSPWMAELAMNLERRMPPF